MNCTATFIGTATLLVEVGHLRILTDPSFDPAGTRHIFEAAPGISLAMHKLTGPAIAASDIGRIDLALISHDEHFDNFDDAGRELVADAGMIITTREGAGRLGENAQGLAPWESSQVGDVTVTAVPARHGPEGSEPVVGHVIGFVLQWPGQRHGAVYISGDTVLYDEVLEVGRRFDIGTAILHLGAGSFDVAPDVRVSMNAADGKTLAESLAARTVIPIHYDGWEHFSERRDVAEQTLGSNALWLEPGIATELEV